MTIPNRVLLPIFILFVFQLTAFAQDASSSGKKSSSEPESSAQKELTMIKKLSKGADVIITGKVSQRKSAWNESKTKIYTKTTLQVEEYLKGKNNGNSLEITTPGGEVGDIGEIYTHMPKFEENEEVLLFLKKSEKNEGYNVLNGEEGKISLRNDKKTKEKVTPSDLPIKELKSQIKTFLNEK